MTLSYLYQPKTAVISAQGTATIVFKPDVGQYWLPTLVHVSVRSGNQARCALNVGGIASLNDPSTQKDFTFQGSNDTSTIVAGTVVGYGEGIALNFSIGFAGDIAFAEIIGLSSDQPPTIGIVPEIAGARFAGALPSGLQNSLIAAPIVNTINNGGSFTTSQFDLRGYQSFGLAIEGIAVPNPATGQNSLTVTLGWSDDVSVNHIVFEQTYGLYSTDKSSIAAGANGNAVWGRLEIQDEVHGVGLNVKIRNNGADQVGTTMDIFGSARTLGQPYFVNTRTIDAALPLVDFSSFADTSSVTFTSGLIGAGAAVFQFLPGLPGAATLWFRSIQQGPFDVNIQKAAGGSPIIYQNVFPVGPNVNTIVPLTLPLSGLRISATNNGAANGQFAFGLTSTVPRIG